MKVRVGPHETFSAREVFTVATGFSIGPHHRAAMQLAGETQVMTLGIGAIMVWFAPRAAEHIPWIQDARKAWKKLVEPHRGGAGFAEEVERFAESLELLYGNKHRLPFGIVGPEDAFKAWAAFSRGEKPYG